MRPLQLVGRNVKRSTGDMQNQKSVLEKQRISICEIFQLSKPRPHINDNTYTTSPRFATHTEETNLHNTSVTTDYALQTSQAPKTSTSSTNHTQAMTSYLSKTALPLLRLQIYKPLPPTPEPWVPHTIAGPSYITQNVGRDV
ncbi:hypothetical protein J1614_003180 [Plenodomus biglobosus]|nr:hypothetical protein J1614_003180 [Plenodomus biglobosus]